MAHLRPATLLLALCIVLVAGSVGAAQEAPKLIAVEYDVRDIVQRPEPLLFRTPWSTFAEDARRLEPAQRAAILVQAIFAIGDKFFPRGAAINPESVEVINASRLIIRTSPAKHAEIESLLRVWRVANHITIRVAVHLHDVDEDFHTRLTNAKPIDWEEQEKRFLGLVKGKPAEAEKLIEELAGQKALQSGDSGQVDDGAVAALLSRQKAVTFLPSPEQVHRRETARQAVLEGVAFLAGVRVSPDRRFVRFQLSEKTTRVASVKKVKVLADNDGKEVDAEIPFLEQTALTREFEVPDGGTILIPVQHQPATLKGKRRLVLSVQPRIRIEEEEETLRGQMLEAVAPLLVADILKNPRLKGTRDFWGTPGDKRFALLNSPTFTWPKDLRIDLPGFVRAAPLRAGNRLVGIRIDQGEPVVVVSLVNVGGNANGPAPGSGTLRYRARETEKGWMVELAEPGEP